MSQVIISPLNPLQFVEMEPQDIPQYQSKHMDDYFLENRLNAWQQLPNGKFLQPWQKNDVINLQFINNMGQVQIWVIDCHQTQYLTALMTQKQANPFDPTYFIYQSSTALSALGEGVYWVMARVGTSPVKKILLSEPIEVLQAHPRTLLIEFYNYEYKNNLIFETGIKLSIRVPGLLRKKPKGRKDTMFEDQELDMVMVKSRTYRIWELIIPNIPDWMEDKFSDIIGCSSIKIDGKYYTANDGAKLDKGDEIGNGTLATYRVELREAINRAGKVFDSDLNTNEELYLMVNSTSKGFAETSGNESSNVVTFIDVE